MCHLVLIAFFSQLVVEVKVAEQLIGAGGNNKSFCMDVFYGSGCRSMAIPISGLYSLLPLITLDPLPAIPTKTAGGEPWACCVWLDVRLLSRDERNVVIDWHHMKRNAYGNIMSRILRGVWRSDVL